MYMYMSVLYFHFDTNNILNTNDTINILKTEHMFCMLDMRSIWI